MQGFQLTFYSQQSYMYEGRPLLEWILLQAQEMGLSGATLTGGLEGLGHDGKLHQMNMYDFSEQPLQLTLILTAADSARLLNMVNSLPVRVFFTKSPVEFGWLGTTLVQ